MTQKTVTLTLTDDQAKEILLALSLRAKQKDADWQKVRNINELGINLSDQFDEAFDWLHGTYERYLKNNVVVTVTPIRPR